VSLDVLHEAARRVRDGQRVGLATLVATRGSTPQKIGARLVAGSDLRLAGTLGGGAVEAAVIGEASRAALEGRAAIREYALSSATDEWGLACGGTMVVFVEPLDAGALRWLEPALRATQGREPVAVVTAVDGAGAGARLLVDEAGEAESVGDVPRPDALALARRVLVAGAPELSASAGGRLYAETFGPPPAIVIAGAGHVGKALAGLGRFLGVRVTVVDDRPEYANRERFPEADRIVAAPVAAGLAALPIGTGTAIVVAMRNHDLDYEAVAAALRTPARYVGLIGARRKAILVVERLAAEGFPLERIRAMRAPVGLDIGARTPEEIAVAIVGEWLMTRQGGGGTPLRLDEQLFLKAATRGTSA
jgi:xanthine dehydrogenase accessory factor